MTDEFGDVRILLLYTWHK